MVKRIKSENTTRLFLDKMDRFALFNSMEMSCYLTKRNTDLCQYVQFKKEISALQVYFKDDITTMVEDLKQKIQITQKVVFNSEGMAKGLLTIKKLV